MAINYVWVCACVRTFTRLCLWSYACVCIRCDVTGHNSLEDKVELVYNLDIDLKHVNRSLPHSPLLITLSSEPSTHQKSHPQPDRRPQDLHRRPSKTIEEMDYHLRRPSALDDSSKPRIYDEYHNLAYCPGPSLQIALTRQHRQSTVVPPRENSNEENHPPRHTQSRTVTTVNTLSRPVSCV